MKLADRRVLLCNCEQTMTLDGKAIAKALRSETEPSIHGNLCRLHMQTFTGALEQGDPLLVACTQEAPLFREVAGDMGSDTPLRFVNIRECAGWTESNSNVEAKIAALLAESVLEPRATGVKTITSDGMCLVYGAGQDALDAAEQLGQRLNVTLVLTDAEGVVPPAAVNVPIYRGTIVRASGSLGGFDVVVDGYAPMVPSSKSSLQFQMPKNGAASTCSLIFDMSGGTPLLSGHKHRDGYFHVDPGYPAGVQKALFEITDLVGEFEKPIYVSYDSDICAHSRNGLVGCSNCIDACPAAAISPAQDGIAVDDGICGGCGTCSAVCPSGAISYAYPGREDQIRQVQTLVSAYRNAGGKQPALLIHDHMHGANLIGAMARFGRGLPGSVLPLAVSSVTLIGHDLLASALNAGAEHIFILCPPDRRDEVAPLRGQGALIEAMMSGLGFTEANRIHILDEQDPDTIEAVLWDCPPAPLASSTPISMFEPVGGKRAIARTAFAKLREIAPASPETILLPANAPYGQVSIDTNGCTLCLSCVSCCPADALLDNPDLPQVSFVEAACLQCGLCVTTCPENVITLDPRYNFSGAALSPEILYRDVPADCIRCGKPFGSKGTIERVAAQLAGKHSMFLKSEQANLIRMCEDCRVIAGVEISPDPMDIGNIPRPRTTEEYLEAEKALKSNGHDTSGSAARLRAQDFLKDDG